MHILRKLFTFYDTDNCCLFSIFFYFFIILSEKINVNNIDHTLNIENVCLLIHDLLPGVNKF